MSKVDLRLDWVGHDAAKFAVEHWHYSKRMPATIQKPAKIGVWEDGRFIGVVIFGHGASSSIGKPYGLGNFEVCELVRVALTVHQSPVSRIVAIAVRILKAHNPNLRLLVSFADPNQNHRGGIYQAGNWVYAGQSSDATVYIAPNGHEFHGRNIGSYTGHDKYGVKKYSRAEMVHEEVRPGKHRYLYPLDDDMRRQIEPLRKPYPKRLPANEAIQDAPGDQSGEGGAHPTRSLLQHEDTDDGRT